MAKSKSGISPKQREQIMRRHGFEFARNGKGSHEIWENAALKKMAETPGTKLPEPPANLRSAIGQKPWEVTIPHDPASGTWRSITKYAEWCQQVSGGKLSGMFNSLSSDRRGEEPPSPGTAPDVRQAAQHSRRITHRHNR